MRAEPFIRPAPYSVVILTLDRHAAGPAARVAPRLAKDFPGLTLSVHAAAEWGERPDALTEARAAVAGADILIVTLLFLDEHVRAILPDLAARREACDALVAMVTDAEIVRLTKMGDLDMSRPASGVMALLKKLKSKPSGSRGHGAGQMRMLRRLPRILKLVPGRAQDLRQWFLSMQYWLGGSDDNVENLVRSLVSRYARVPAWREARATPPVEYPEVGLYHPDLPGRGIAADLAALPSAPGAAGTVGVLMLRSYVLAGDTAHYDAMIRALEAKGLRVIPAFAGGLDGRPAIDAYMAGGRIDALLSLTGFSLVGGPAYNDAEAAAEALERARRALRQRSALGVPDAPPVGALGAGAGARRDDHARRPARDRRRDARRRSSPAGTAWKGATAVREGAMRALVPMRRRWRPVSNALPCWPRRCAGWPRCAGRAMPTRPSESSCSAFRPMPVPPERPRISASSSRSMPRSTA